MVKPKNRPPLSRWQRFRAFSKRKIHDYPRDLPPRSVIKASGLMLVGPIILLTVLTLYHYVDLKVALWSMVFLFCISMIFIFPYLTNLTALRNYVQRLTEDQYANAPDLRFLSVVEELQTAVQELHDKWQRRGQQLEATLQESQVLINSLPDVIIMLDANRKLIRTNSTAKQVFGRSDYRTTVESIITHETIRHALDEAEKINDGVAVQYDLGEPYNLHYIARVEPFPKQSPGNIALLIVLHDITTQKQTEHMLSDFVANASHEIRTPLTSVRGYIETLQTVAKDDPEATEKFLNTMSGQADRMADLVEDLLSLSRIERMMSTEPAERLDIKPVIRQVIKQLKELAAAHSITLKFKGEKKNMPQIFGDNNQLFQVIENLISNAIKYGQADTEVVVEIDHDDTWLNLSVTDKGIGIPADDIPRLTERFYRVDKGRSRQIGGNGLGLAIVSQIVQRHRGELEIESIEGEGSTFTIKLPLPVESNKKSK